MRSVLFFLSAGLLALGDNLPRTPGQNVTGGAPIPPNNNGFPLPTEKLFLALPNTFLCVVEGFDTNETNVTWFRKGEPAAVTIHSTSDQHNTPVIVSGFRVPQDDWTRGRTYDCVVQADVDVGNPLTFNQILFRPRFQEDEANSVVSISCMLIGLCPPDVSIVWHKNFSPLPEDGFAIHHGSKENYFLYSTLTFRSPMPFPERSYSCAIG